MHSITAAINDISLWHIFSSHFNWLFILIFGGGGVAASRS